jgi:spermidine/putrescine transport system ATP-binding protein|tara:strand:- start:769 stop:1851 length:1083 start_codon:yes stop_codon:yes gene_type:complete
MTQPIIQLSGLDKFYGNFQALSQVNLDIQTGEFFSLLGPSGCGKTTLLRAIAGFERLSAGTLNIDGLSMEGVPANKRPTNMVFQSYAIFPHMSVAENVAYGLKARKLPKAEIKVRVAEAINMVGLEGFDERASHALSGGQRQRVALARALVLKPRVLLLDEPLSALDKKLREQMQSELRRLQRAVGITFVLVTHDQEEALTMSDRIAVMFDGKIEQVASPQILYGKPITRKVAAFIGMMNFLDTKILTTSGDNVEVEVQSLGKLTLPLEQATGGLDGCNSIGVRPEMLTILMGSQTSEREIEAEVTEVYYYGDMTYYDVKLPAKEDPITVTMRNTAGREVLEVGAKARVGWSTSSLLLLK